jgi:hypothetical protein
VSVDVSYSLSARRSPPSAETGSVAHILVVLLVPSLLPRLSPSFRGYFATLALVVGGIDALSALRVAPGKTYSFHV